MGNKLYFITQKQKQLRNSILKRMKKVENILIPKTEDMLREAIDIDDNILQAQLEDEIYRYEKEFEKLSNKLGEFDKRLQDKYKHMIFSNIGGTNERK